MDRDAAIALIIAFVVLIIYVVLCVLFTAAIAYVIWVLFWHTNFFLVWLVTGLVLAVFGGFSLEINVRV